MYICHVTLTEQCVRLLRYMSSVYICQQLTEQCVHLSGYIN